MIYSIGLQNAVAFKLLNKYDFIIFKQLVIIFFLSDAIVLPRSPPPPFLMHVLPSYVMSLISEAVLCLELVFVELGQAHYK